MLGIQRSLMFAGQESSAGPGSRGIVYGGRGTPTNPGMGHSCNVVNQRGTPTFLDGQTGRIVNYASDFDWYALLRTQ